MCENDANHDDVRCVCCVSCASDFTAGPVIEVFLSFFACLLRRASLRLLFGQSLNNFACFVERFAIGFVELRDGLRQPCALCVFRAFSHGGAFCGQRDVELAPVGRVSAPLDEATFFERRDGGAHRLRLDAFGAGEVGGGGGAVDVESPHHGGFGHGQLV